MLFARTLFINRFRALLHLANGAAQLFKARGRFRNFALVPFKSQLKLAALRLLAPEFRRSCAAALGCCCCRRSVFAQTFVLRFGCASCLCQKSCGLSNRFGSCQTRRFCCLGFCERSRAPFFKLKTLLLKSSSIVRNHALMTLCALNLLRDCASVQLARHSVALLAPYGFVQKNN